MFAVELVENLSGRVDASEQELEGLLEKRESLRVLGGGALALFAVELVQIAGLGDAGKPALLHFGFESPLGVDAQIPHELIGHAQLNANHQHIVGRIVTAVVGLDMSDNALLQEPTDIAAVHRIASQAVQFPTENAVGLTAPEARQHVVEHRSPGFFGGLRFGQNIHHRQMFPRNDGLQFLDLRVNGGDLPVFAFARFAGVEKVFDC